jgi:hypothetical protein
MEKSYNLLYKGRKIYTNLSAEECTEVLQEFSERFFSGEDIDPNLIELENNKTVFESGGPKKTRQGRSARTLLSATSRNGRKKKYRGQGK